MPELAQKVVKSVDNITTRSCETLQLGGLCLTASRDSWIQTEHSWTSDMPQKQPQEKQTGELLATIHAPMDCLIMYLYNGGEICVLKWCAYNTPSCKSGHKLR